MSDPERLIREDADEFEQSLLRSARNDGPSRNGKARVLFAVGLGTTLAGGASTTAAAAAPSAAISVLKWMAVGAIVGTGTLASVSALTPADAPAPAPSSSVAPRRPASPVLPALPAPKTASSTPEILPEPIPSAPSAAQARPPVPTTTQERAPEPASVLPATPPSAPIATAIAEDPLVGELLLLDGARTALASGNTDLARSSLQQHASRYPRGKLSTEAKVLGIELLLRQGDRAAAQREAETFLQAHPRSPHAPRLRTLFGIATPETIP